MYCQIIPGLYSNDYINFKIINKFKRLIEAFVGNMENAITFEEGAK